jgi:hypothetical protein
MLRHAAYPCAPAWPHRVTRDANDAVLFAQQIERFGGFFSETDDPLWWIHTKLKLAVLLRGNAL